MARWLGVGASANLVLLLLLPLVLLLLTLGCMGRRASKTQLYIAGFFPLSQDQAQGKLGRGVLPAVHLALKHLNSNPKVLGDYYLDILHNNTQCDAAVGMKDFFDMVFKPPPKMLLFGAACTQVTDPIAKTSRYWHLSQLSYADTHPMFSGEKYPNFFRVVPSETDFNPPRVQLLLNFNWRLIGTIYQNDPRYALAHNKLLNDLDAQKIEIAETQSVAEELSTQMAKLKDKDVRIILGNFNETWARKIFCEAHLKGMTGRKYQWLIVTMYSKAWWDIRDPGLECNREQMLQALEGYIATDLLPLRTDNVTTVSGRTAHEYEHEYNSVRQKEYSRFHGYAYDGIWTTALAIDAVIDKLQSRNTKLTIRDFQYRDSFWGDLFHETLNETNFEGVTGPVKFNNNDRKGFIQITQFQGGKEVKIGEYNGITGNLDLTKGSPIIWRGSGPPRDRLRIFYEQTRVNLTIYSILACISSFGIIAAFVFLFINIKFRNQRFIKMSSPYLNNMIIIGCILTYTSVILLGLDSGLTSIEAFPYICTVRAWVLMSGFSLAFGSMFSKTWRVHAIFTNIKLNKKVIKDYQLFMVVAILLGVDIAIMTTWQAIDPFYRETKHLQASAPPTNDDLNVVPVIEFCKSSHMTVFLGVIYAYKGLLMVFGCFLAWETRHVSIPALNDSKYIGMSVYNVVIMCVIGAAISFILAEQQNASFIIISVFIIFCTTTTLCLVFVPKWIELKRNPKGTDKRVRATFKPSLKKRRDSEESDLQESVKVLQEENQKYRKTLRENDLELQSLLRQLGEDAQEIFGAAEARDRSKAPRRVEILRREVAFVDVGGNNVVEDEDMNSMFSSSSQDGEQTQSTMMMDTLTERKPAQYSCNLPTIEASRENVSDSRRESEDLQQQQQQQQQQHYRNNNNHYNSTVESPPYYHPQTGFTEIVPLISFNGGPQQHAARRRSNAAKDSYVHSVPLIDFRQKAVDEDVASSSQSEPDVELQTEEYPPEEVPKDTASTVRESEESESSGSRTCSVFTIQTSSPTLQLRRAFSWGKKGYLPMLNRHSQVVDPSVHDDVIPHGTGSLPNIAQGRKGSTSSFSKRRIMSPKSLNLLCHVSRLHHSKGQTSSNNTSSQDCNASSYPTLKCDIVEYL